MNCGILIFFHINANKEQLSVFRAAFSAGSLFFLEKSRECGDF